MTPAQFAALLLQMAQNMHHAAHTALEQAALVVEKEAKAEIGTYQSAAGPFPAWAPLTPATVADRVAKGFTPDDPLLQTGAMRDSIEHQVKMTGLVDGEAHIGSDSDIAVYQELGTSRGIPPRSFLGGAAFRKSHEVKQILGNGVVGVLSGTHNPNPVKVI